MTIYQYSDGSTSCGHRHRTPNAARMCPDHLRLIRAWWREGDGDGAQTYRQYRADSIAKAEVLVEERGL